MGDRWGSRETLVRKSTMSKQRYGKPPRGCWKPTVPSWEKEFCATVCLIPWRKILETKKVMPLYDNVVQWNDSAGEEAFTNAKRRFWAEINGLPCDVSPPDPDIYIDEIDWNSIGEGTDRDILISLEEEADLGDQSKDDTNKSTSPDILSGIWENQRVTPIPCSGWGDDIDQPLPLANGPWFSGGTQNNERFGEERNSWDACEFRPDHDKGNAPTTSSGWDDAGVQDWSVNERGAEYGWGKEFENSPPKCQDHNHGLTECSNYGQPLRGKRNWANGNWNGRKREGGRRYVSRYNKTTRYQSRAGEALHGNGAGWRNCNRRKGAVHITSEGAVIGK